MAMVAMGGHRHITATVDPVALVQVGVIPIEDAGAVGVTGDQIHLHGNSNEGNKNEELWKLYPTEQK